MVSACRRSREVIADPTPRQRERSQCYPYHGEKVLSHADASRLEC